MLSAAEAKKAAEAATHAKILHDADYVKTALIPGVARLVQEESRQGKGTEYKWTPPNAATQYQLDLLKKFLVEEMKYRVVIAKDSKKCYCDHICQCQHVFILYTDSV